MDLEKVLSDRYSCRSFDSNVVIEESEIKRILQVARLSQSANNQQPYHFYVLKKSAINKLDSVRDWYDAPCMILGCITHEPGWVRPSDQIPFRMLDLGIVFENMVLEAVNLGLNTCLISSYDPNKLKDILSLPEDHYPIVCLLLGHAIDGSKPNVNHILRKDMQELYSILE